MNSPHTPPSFCHVAQQVRRDKLRFDQPIFDLSSSFDPFTLPSNLELLPYNNSSNSPLSQMLPPSLTLAPNNTTTMISMGPLGPFTGYAIIVRGSRFLKPAQMLLEEFCVAVMGDDKGERERLLREDFDGVSDSSLSSSNEKGNVCKPEFEEKKAKLLYMQEEVSRRYKQYQQQMQMVVSSFESVPGLSSATPYTFQALKSVSRHFRRIKNVISNQLKQLSRMLGEESTSSPCRGVTAGKSNTRLPYMEHNHPVWRPQRGLPERAVSVLRAWLFDHFLHPYPTDTDKHMLASQTGLSRNQVSNWFINARVRLWKPMVEEIHMLETKGKNTNSTNKLDSKNGAIEPTDTIFEHNNNNSPLLDVGFIEPALREKSTDQCMDAMEENMISFGGFTEAKIDHLGAGFGPVSLTLGLRHDSVYQQYQQQQQQQQQLRHFGGQMLHDFVG